MAILSDKTIKEYLKEGKISIKPLKDEKQIQEEAQETIQDKINDGAKAVYNVASFLVGGNKKYKRRRSF